MTVSAADFGYISALVHQSSGIVLEPGKEYLVESRLLPVARELGCATVGDVVRVLRSSPRAPLATRVVAAMTTNETSWFRDRHPFDLLTDELLPTLEATRNRERRIRVWSAASSSGQEAYSIAMLLADWLGAHPGWSASILATDLSEEMLSKGRSGLYNQLEVDRGLPAALLARHFRRVGAQWQLSAELRRMVEFRALNLAGPLPPMQPFDVVFCRNVLIYFDTATRRQVLSRIASVLRPDGSLLLGAAETTLNLDSGFERVQVGRAACYRQRASPASRNLPTVPVCAAAVARTPRPTGAPQ